MDYGWVSFEYAEGTLFTLGSEYCIYIIFFSFCFFICIWTSGNLWKEKHLYMLRVQGGLSFFEIKHLTCFVRVSNARFNQKQWI